MATESKKPEKKREEEVIVKALPLKRLNMENIVLQYANYVTCQQSQYEFIFSFFTMEEPYAEEEDSGPDHMPAKCFSRIAIPKELMPKLLDVIARVMVPNIDALIKAQIEKAEKENKKP